MNYCKASLKIFILAFAFLTAIALANDATFFALQGDGSASVLVDDESNRAYVIDGGKSAKFGLMGAKIGDDDPLGNLIERGIRELYIICSHPRRDHMSGLINMIKDERIGLFTKVVFIDNEYERRTGRIALFSLFKQHWGKPGPKGPKGPDAGYMAAKGRLPLEPDGGGGGIALELFTDDSVGRDEHDRSIISAYRISGKDAENTIVDFDDASKKLIKKWTNETSLEPTTLVISHHGSKYNYSKDILDSHPSVRDVVITVNDYNQYYHPSAEVLFDLVRRLGADHVFITRSDAGSNIVARADEIVVDGDNRERLASFVALQMERENANIETLYELADSAVSPADAQKIESAMSPDLELIDRLVASGMLKPRKASFFRRSVEALPMLGAVHAMARSHLQPAEPLDVALSSVVSRWKRTSVEEVGEGSNNGTDRYFSKQKELQKAASEAIVSSESIGSSIPGLSSAPGMGSQDGSISTAGTGNGGATSVGSSGLGGSSGGGGVLFQTAISRLSPIFGGIVLGNASSSPSPKTLEFLTFKGDGDPIVIIRVEFADGRIADYADFTKGELWSAYNFVQPTDSFRKDYPEAISNSAGLVGVSDIKPDHWEFGIHPAIANTVFAIPAMRLDMFLATLKDTKPLPEYSASVPIEDFLGLTYQWFDAPAHFEIDGARLFIRATSAPEECLMRLRLIEVELPPWLDIEDLEGSFTREIKRRVDIRRKDFFQAVAPDLPPPADESELAFKAWFEKALSNKSEKEIEEILVSAMGEMFLMSFKIQSEVLSEFSLLSNADRMTPYVGSLCRSYRPLVKINRLAKLIALLNWYRGDEGRSLPPMPLEATPASRKTPASYNVEDVL